MTGPKPETDKEYLIEIYNRQGKQNKDIRTLCDGLHDHEKRIRKLEISEACEDSYYAGKTSVWINYKEFILVLVTVVLTGFGSIILFKLGFSP